MTFHIAFFPSSKRFCATQNLPLRAETNATSKDRFFFAGQDEKEKKIKASAEADALLPMVIYFCTVKRNASKTSPVAE